MIDQTQMLVRRVIAGPSSFESKLNMLAATEPIIEQNYALGKTNVLPISMMTADDLVS